MDQNHVGARDLGFAKDRKGIHLEARIGGKFYEDWGNGSGALYATVNFLKPNEKLRLTGPMGMLGAVHGTIEFELEPAGKKSKLKLFHSIMGEIDETTHSNYSEGGPALLGSALPKFLQSQEKNG